MKRVDEWCDECPDHDTCDDFRRCCLEALKDPRPLSALSPDELLDAVCPSEPLPPSTEESEAA